MNQKFIQFIKNFSYSLFSNLFSLLISALVVLVIPRIIGVEDYGFWQLYIFYSTYVGFFHLGWNDGIYLRYGGSQYKKLDFNLFNSQFYLMFAFQIVLAVIVGCASYLIIDDKTRLFVIFMTLASMVIVNLRYMLLFTLQATNQIKQYAQITVIDRLFYMAILLSLLFFKATSFKLMIFADVISKLISLFYAIYLTKDIVLQKISVTIESFHEALKNIQVGSKLMLSNIASNLIIGTIRFGIEGTWGVAIFGQISLTLSVTNLIMMFINSIGIVIFPIIKKIDNQKLESLYISMKDFLILIVFGALIFYYPFKNILSLWLPNYAQSLNYMGILFPIVVFESKLSMLINPYLKAFRKEKIILFINFLTVVISVVLTIISTFWLKNLTLAIVSIVVLISFKSILFEYYLSKIIRIKMLKNTILEISISVIFIYVSWNVQSYISTVIYMCVYILFVFIKWQDLKKSYGYLKTIVFSRRET